MTDEKKRVRVIVGMIYEQNQDLDAAAYRRVLEGIKAEMERLLYDGPYLFDEEEN
jgi:hypothetical protein